LEPRLQLRQKLVAFLPAQLFDQLHSDWKDVLLPLADSIAQIEHKLKGTEIAPEFGNIFRSLSKPISASKVVIFGQDPYPTKGHADGLAFSVSSFVTPLPPTLRNIFSELHDDCGISRNSGDLSDWFEQGVLLVNRIFTTVVGTSLSHVELGWQEITTAVAEELGNRDVVAILWGKNAGELASYFRPEWLIQSVHPSPLSSYRGFFGSKPFSRSNDILIRNGVQPINW